MLVGTACIDSYEASVWSTTDATVIAKIKDGTVTLADLTAGATRHGESSDDYDPGCPDNPAGCTDFYAVSIAGVTPSRFINWFQSAAACRNSNKRFPSNAEWQAAAFGTPSSGTDDDTTDCNVSSDSGQDPVPTGSRASCISDVGTFDMVGNLAEWVGDWVPRSTACPGWGAERTSPFSDDRMCLAGANESTGPGALLRGGSSADGPSAGVFAVVGLSQPYDANSFIGFRCAR
jgi:formylglycine-generating enzyme required for sulfatase activity